VLEIPDYDEAIFHDGEISMAMQNEDNDVNVNSNQQRMGDGADNNTVGNPATTEDDQQAAMPPSETDDDQYDQGTVKRES